MIRITREYLNVVHNRNRQVHFDFSLRPNFEIGFSFSGNNLLNAITKIRTMIKLWSKIDTINAKSLNTQEDN